MRVESKKVAERKKGRYSLKKIQDYIKTYAANCRYSYKQMLSL